MRLKRLSLWELEELKDRLLEPNLNAHDLADSLNLVKESYLGKERPKPISDLRGLRPYLSDVSKYFGQPLMKHVLVNCLKYSVDQRDYLALDLKELLLLRQNGRQDEEDTFLSKAKSAFTWLFDSFQEIDAMEELNKRAMYGVVKREYTGLFSSLEKITETHIEFWPEKSLGKLLTLADILQNPADMLATKVREVTYDKDACKLRAEYFF